MGNPVTLQYPGGPDSSMVEHLVQFQKGLGSSPGLVTFHAAICKGDWAQDSRRILSYITVCGYDTTYLQENPQRLG